MSSILITGAYGFIGKRIADILAASGHDLRVFDINREATYFYRNCLIGDITKINECRQAVVGVDAVVHLAGSKRSRKAFWPVNVKGTNNLLTASLEQGIKRFVHFSSVGVLGANPLRRKSFSEDSPGFPSNDYERSKRKAENLAFEASKRGLPLTILRPANVFGDGDPEKHLLALARSVLEGRFVYLGGRDAVVNCVFVDDVARVCLASIERDEAVNRIYHISDSCTMSEFVEAIADELGVRKPKHEIPRPVTTSIRFALRIMHKFPGFLGSRAISRFVSLNNQAKFSTSRLFDELGFTYPVGWRQGVKRMIAWYRAQGDL